MDIHAINRVFGTNVDSGYAVYAWNVDGTLASKTVYADAGHTQLIYTKTFVWSSGTLVSWSIVVATTGEVISKSFTFDVDGKLTDTAAA
jgi:hypothetical protein